MALLLCAGLLTACDDSQASSLAELETLTEQTTTVTTAETTAADPRKTALDEANALVKAGDYDALLKALAEGEMKDYSGDPEFAALYQQAENALSQDVKKTVQQFLDQGDNISAYQEAQKAADAHPDCKALKDLVDELFSVQKESIIKSTEENRDLYLNNLDYQGAEKFIKMQIETYPNIPELADMMKGMASRYSELVQARAKTLFIQGDIEEAVSLLDQAIASIGKNEDLTKLRTQYGYYVPTYIHTLRAVDYNDVLPYSSHTLTPDECRDAVGNPHESMFYLGTEADPASQSYAEYYLGGIYNEFRGVYGSSYANRGTNMAARFLIYGDGVLLYTSPAVSPSVIPREFKVNVTGVQRLKIVYPAGMYAPNSCAAIFDATLKRNVQSIQTTTAAGSGSAGTTASTSRTWWSRTTTTTTAATSRTWWSRTTATAATSRTWWSRPAN